MRNVKRFFDERRASLLLRHFRRLNKILRFNNEGKWDALMILQVFRCC